MSDLAQIRLVLVEPTHPGNIGAVARAMKTMGLTDLTLVNPKKFPHYEAMKRAAGAQDILEQAVVVNTLTQAIADVTLVLGTSVRDREVSWPTVCPRASAQKCAQHIDEHVIKHKVAILFGRESSGLSNDEMDLCHWQIRIDANPEYSSLNLASAVQIICYEMRLAIGTDKHATTETTLTPAQKRQLGATKAQLSGHLEHLKSTLETLDFIKAKPPTVLMRKLTRLYNKAQLTIEEVQILRGIYSAINDKVNDNKP